MNYHEYCTVYDVRQQHFASASTLDDDLFRTLIRRISGDIDHIARWSFVPRYQKRYFSIYDCEHAMLILDEPLLEITSLTNGDGATLTSSHYYLLPTNETPHWEIYLRALSGKMWTYTEDPLNAIAVEGFWGYHDNYGSAWETVGVLAALLDSTSTTLALGVDVRAGEVWRIENELIYIDDWDGTTATLVRGVNGTTAASHAAGQTLRRWQVMDSVNQIAVEAVAARYRLRDNPTADITTVDGVVVQKPKDVDVYLQDRLARVGLIRVL